MPECAFTHVAPLLLESLSCLPQASNYCREVPALLYSWLTGTERDDTKSDACVGNKPIVWSFHAPKASPAPWMRMKIRRGTKMFSLPPSEASGGNTAGAFLWSQRHDEARRALRILCRLCFCGMCACKHGAALLTTLSLHRGLL